jgi:hypothetical protein
MVFYGSTMIQIKGPLSKSFELGSFIDAYFGKIKTAAPRTEHAKGLSIIAKRLHVDRCHAEQPASFKLS